MSTYQELAQEAAEATRTKAWWDRMWHRAKEANRQHAQERRDAAQDLEDRMVELDRQHRRDMRQDRISKLAKVWAQEDRTRAHRGYA